MISEAKKEIINNYGDNTLKELIEQLNKVETETDLINWLTFATQHNYYTGSVWTPIYNECGELENKVLNIINDEEYLKYLTFKCDESDIFLFVNSKDILEIEADKSEKVTHALRYSRILTREEFNNIHYYDENAAFDYINEVYEIPEHLILYIKYDHIIYNMGLDENIYSLHGDKEFIIDENEGGIY